MTGRTIRHALRRRLGEAAVLAGLSLALSACSSIPHITNPFSSSSSSPGNAWTATVTEENMLSAARDGGNVTGATEDGCPTFGLASRGEGFVTIKSVGAEKPGDPLSAVKHRGEITKTARECTAGPGGVIVKYGLAGRVLLGPQGKPGMITLAVKLSVVDGARRTVKTQPVKVPVSIGAGESVGYFSVVHEILVPVAPGTSPESYKVYAAFDRSVPGAS